MRLSELSRFLADVLSYINQGLLIAVSGDQASLLLPLNMGRIISLLCKMLEQFCLSGSYLNP